MIEEDINRVNYLYGHFFSKKIKDVATINTNNNQVTIRVQRLLSNEFYEINTSLNTIKNVYIEDVNENELEEIILIGYSNKYLKCLIFQYDGIKFIEILNTEQLNELKNIEILDINTIRLKSRSRINIHTLNQNTFNTNNRLSITPINEINYNNTNIHQIVMKQYILNDANKFVFDYITTTTFIDDKVQSKYDLIPHVVSNSRDVIEDKLLEYQENYINEYLNQEDLVNKQENKEYKLLYESDYFSLDPFSLGLIVNKIYTRDNSLYVDAFLINLDQKVITEITKFNITLENTKGIQIAKKTFDSIPLEYKLYPNEGQRINLKFNKDEYSIEGENTFEIYWNYTYDFNSLEK